MARTVAVWAYEGAPRALILALKVRNMKTAATPIVAALVGACRTRRVVADLVTWVPARRADVARRGFDHAEVLARGIASGLGLPSARLLERTDHRPDQAGLTRDQRLTNLRGAFTAKSSAGARVLLVDDLVTTGATAAACTGALRRAGASRIDLGVACRA